jgi:hypothetical protein
MACKSCGDKPRPVKKGTLKVKEVKKKPVVRQKTWRNNV